MVVHSYNEALSTQILIWSLYKIVVLEIHVYLAMNGAKWAPDDQGPSIGGSQIFECDR